MSDSSVQFSYIFNSQVSLLYDDSPYDELQRGEDIHRLFGTLKSLCTSPCTPVDRVLSRRKSPYLTSTVFTASYIGGL